MSAFAPFTFLHISDHRLGTPRSWRFRPAVNRRWAAIKSQLAAVDADLLMIGGDLTRLHSGRHRRVLRSWDGPVRGVRRLGPPGPRGRLRLRTTR